MNKKIVSVLLLIIGQIWAAPNVQQAPTPAAQTVHGTSHRALESANKALAVYNRTLDTVIPWQIFRDVIASLDEHQGRYSAEAGALVGNISRCLLNSEDHYFHATMSIYNWCGESVDLIDAYLILFKDYDAEKAKDQKTVLLEVLKNGIEKMDQAISNLNLTGMSFNEAAGFLKTLDNQLSLDSREESKQFQKDIDQVRLIQGLTWINPIAGLITVIYTEIKTIPDLKAALKQVQEFYTKLQDKVKLAVDTIDIAKVELKKEVRIIGDMRSATENTKTFVRLSSNLFAQIEKSSKSLINQCTEFQARHRNSVKKLK